MVVVVEGERLVELQRILIDEDAEAALRFLKEVFSGPLREAEHGHCRPVFEWGGREPEIYRSLAGTKALPGASGNEGGHEGGG